MQYSILINQSRAVEWGLNSQQAFLFAYLYGVPSWADLIVVDGVSYYRLDREKVLSDLPLLSDKLDTIYRLIKQLVDAGLLWVVRTGNRTAIRLTEKGAQWNHAATSPDSAPVDKHQKSVDKSKDDSESGEIHSEKNPSSPGKISEIHPEKNPTNSLYINNNNIKQTIHQRIYQGSPREALGDVDNSAVEKPVDQGGQPADLFPNADPGKPGRQEYPDWFAKLWEKYPPRQGASDKRKALHAAKARLREGKTPDDLLAAIDRYARFIRATGRWGSQFVMQAQTFFGPGGHIENSWSFNHAANQPNFVPRESLVDRILRQADEVCADADAIAAGSRFVDPNDPDFRP